VVFTLSDVVQQTGQLVRFSQQELVDCSWGQGNNGCNGGEDFRAYQWIMKHGLATEEAYGSYMGVVCILPPPRFCIDYAIYRVSANSWLIKW
jgi:Papain family cysteine protease